MTKIEKIQVLLDSVETDVRKETLKDVVATLKDFLPNSPESELAGIKAAIEIIESNY